jgi:hypothetical protein
MSSSQRTVSLLIGLVLILGIAWQFAGAQVDKAQRAQKWEYKQTSIATGDDGAFQLSKLGEDGWELVAAYGYGTERAIAHRCILKRPK